MKASFWITPSFETDQEYEQAWYRFLRGWRDLAETLVRQSASGEGGKTAAGEGPALRGNPT